MQSYYKDQDPILNFGDIFAANLNKIKCWPRDKEGWLQKAAWVKNDWQIVSHWIRHEEEQKSEHGMIEQPMGENPDGVRDDVVRAAWRLGIDREDLAWEIHLYAERNHMADLGITKDAEDCRFGHVAKILASLMEKLDCSNLPPELRGQYRNAIRTFEKKYFVLIAYSHSPPTYILTRHHSERCVEKQEKDQDEEARLQTLEQRQQASDVQKSTEKSNGRSKSSKNQPYYRTKGMRGC